MQRSTVRISHEAQYSDPARAPRGARGETSPHFVDAPASAPILSADASSAGRSSRRRKARGLAAQKGGALRARARGRDASVYMLVEIYVLDNMLGGWGPQGAYFWEISHAADPSSSLQPPRAPTARRARGRSRKCAHGDLRVTMYFAMHPRLYGGDTRYMGAGAGVPPQQVQQWGCRSE